MTRKEELQEQINKLQNSIRPLRNELNDIESEEKEIFRKTSLYQFVKNNPREKVILMDRTNPEDLKILVGTLMITYSETELSFDGIEASYEIYEYPDEGIRSEIGFGEVNMRNHHGINPDHITILKPTDLLYVEFKNFLENVLKIITIK